MNALYMIKEIKKNLNGLLILLFTFSCNQETAITDFEAVIQPYKENPRYWQFKGDPVLLLGGSNDDNLFQWPAELLIPHLDSIKAEGGNYVRNTMSDRVDKDFELYPFKKLDNSKYDLNLWNEEFWNRFEFFLSETNKRDIIVQIEIWDRFDYSTRNWPPHPYNPANNINYTYEESGFEPEYPEHPGRNKQPFFFTTPSQRDNKAVFQYQQAFVKKLLSISLNYGHVLYCIDNETSGEEAWATYWAEFVRSEAGDHKINITQMWNAKQDMLDEEQRRTIDHPERYDFIDLAQNSWNQGYRNWENSQKVMDHIKDNPRPVNSTKIYGSDKHSNPNINKEHAVQTFFRNIIGGFASSRFHRPDGGLGFSETSINCIKAIRKVESAVKFWEMNPHMNQLIDFNQNEAYLTAKEGSTYLIYFPGKGNVKLDLNNHQWPFEVRWINIENAEWEDNAIVEGGKIIEIESKFEKGCLVIISKKEQL
jgi:hypothetical protein